MRMEDNPITYIKVWVYIISFNLIGILLYKVSNIDRMIIYRFNAYPSIPSNDKIPCGVIYGLHKG